MLKESASTRVSWKTPDRQESKEETTGKGKGGGSERGSRVEWREMMVVKEGDDLVVEQLVLLWKSQTHHWVSETRRENDSGDTTTQQAGHAGCSRRLNKARRDACGSGQRATPALHRRESHPPAPCVKISIDHSRYLIDRASYSKPQTALMTALRRKSLRHWNMSAAAASVVDLGAEDGVSLGRVQ